jgi:hypothetical protein
MGTACRIYGRQVKCTYNNGRETRREETTCETRRRLEDNIKMDVKRIGCDCGLDSGFPESGPVAGSCKYDN